MNSATLQIRSPIDPDTRVGRVSLRVANLDRSAAFYHDLLGFTVRERTEDRLILGSTAHDLIELREVPGLGPAVAHATGLFHVALLLPSRRALGQVLIRLIEAKVRFGHSDHLVSEALYLSDPDGNGLEIYRDRQRTEWKWDGGGRVKMAVDPLKLDEIYAEGMTGASWNGMPPETRVGHIHLRVGDLDQARQFYHEMLGFDVTAAMSGALFVSAGGYHHHLGLNVWESQGAAPAPADTAGLDSYDIDLISAEARDAVVARLSAAGIPATPEDNGAISVLDPWETKIRLTITGRD